MLALGVHNLLLTVLLSLALGAYSLLCWPWTAHGRPGRGMRSEIDKFVTFSAIGSIASSGMLYLSQMITGWFGDAASGVYAAAAQLVTPMAMITGALTAVLYPALAAAHGAGDSEKLRSHTDLTTRGFVALLVPVFGALAIASRPLIHLIYELGRGKEGYMEAAVLMPVFCVALLLNNVATPVGQRGHQRRAQERALLDAAVPGRVADRDRRVGDDGAFPRALRDRSGLDRKAHV